MGWEAGNEKMGEEAGGESVGKNVAGRERGGGYSLGRGKRMHGGYGDRECGGGREWEGEWS